MRIIKLAGAVFVLFSALFTACTLTKADSRKLDRTDALLSLMRFIRAEIDGYLLPVGKIFVRCDKELLLRCGYVGVPSDPDEFVRGLAPGLPPEVSEILSSFASELGGSYLSEQLKSCDRHIARLEETQKKLSAGAKDRKKLTFTVCVSAALAIIILLI